MTFRGRCLVYWPDNGHFYELIDDAMLWQDAQDRATRSRLEGPYHSREKGAYTRLRPGECLQGYLWTVGSREEHDYVLGRFGRPETGGLWLGASDTQVEGEWRWVSGPEAGTLFWSGGAKGRGGRVHAKQFESWRSGEPNNNGVPDGHALEEDRAGTLGEWNDVTSSSRLRPVIEYGGVPCR